MCLNSHLMVLLGVDGKFKSIPQLEEVGHWEVPMRRIWEPWLYPLCLLSNQRMYGPLFYPSYQHNTLY